MTLELLLKEEHRKGERNKVCDIARKMLEYGEIPEKIELYTDLSASEIQELQKNIFKHLGSQCHIRTQK